MPDTEQLRTRLRRYVEAYTPGERGGVLDSKRKGYRHRNQEALAQAIGIADRTLRKFLAGGSASRGTLGLIEAFLEESPPPDDDRPGASPSGALATEALITELAQRKGVPPEKLDALLDLLAA